MQIQIDIPSDEAQAVERLLASALDLYQSSMSGPLLRGAVRVRQALAVAARKPCEICIGGVQPVKCFACAAKDRA